MCNDYHEIFNSINKPAYVFIEETLLKNINIFKRIEKETGCEVFYSQKAAPVYQLYNHFKQLSGLAASSKNEVLLAKEFGAKNIICYAPAYRKDEFMCIAENADTIVFNSKNQLDSFKHLVPEQTNVGLRINPCFSTSIDPTCDPCVPGSRLGITHDDFEEIFSDVKDHINGIMFHSLHRSDFTTFMNTMESVEHQFSKYLHHLEWISFGGGASIPAFSETEIETLIRYIRIFQKRYQIKVILEPGEGCLLNTCFLVTEVLDIVKNGDKKSALLNISPFAHFDNVVHQKKPPKVFGADYGGDRGENTFALAGCSCLSGDEIGNYTFKRPLQIGDLVIFQDMGMYSIATNQFFNGIARPDIAIIHTNGQYDILFQSSYELYKKFF